MSKGDTRKLSGRRDLSEPRGGRVGLQERLVKQMIFELGLKILVVRTRTLWVGRWGQRPVCAFMSLA